MVLEVKVLLSVTSCSYTSNYQFIAEDNSLIAIIGPNGSGKSTFLKNISGAVRPAICSVIIDGEDVSELTAPQMIRRGVVLVPEGKANFPEMTVEENLRLGFHIVGITGKRRQEMLEDIFRLFPVLRDRKNQVAKTLSGGEQRMLAIARGLATNPKILLLDEPSLGLAPKVVEAIYSTLMEIKEAGRTVIVAEQGISAILNFREHFDKVYFVMNHQFVYSGSVENLEKIEEVRRVYFGV